MNATLVVYLDPEAWADLAVLFMMGAALGALAIVFIMRRCK